MQNIMDNKTEDGATTGDRAPVPGAATTVVIPVVDEVLHVGVRTVDRGGAAVHIRVENREEPVERELMQEVLSVERVAVGRIVETAPSIREEGDVTIIPVLEEELVVTKRLVLREEIHIRRQRKQTVWKDTVTLQREIATVEPTGESSA